MSTDTPLCITPNPIILFVRAYLAEWKDKGRKAGNARHSRSSKASWPRRHRANKTSFASAAVRMTPNPRRTPNHFTPDRNRPGVSKDNKRPALSTEKRRRTAQLAEGKVTLPPLRATPKNAPRHGTRPSCESPVPPPANEIATPALSPSPELEKALTEKEMRLSTLEQLVHDKDAMIKERDAKIEDLKQMTLRVTKQSLAEKEGTLETIRRAIEDMDQKINHNDAKIAQLAELTRDVQALETQATSTNEGLEKALEEKEQTLCRLMQLIQEKDAKITELNGMTAKLTKHVQSAHKAVSSELHKALEEKERTLAEKERAVDELKRVIKDKDLKIMQLTAEAEVALSANKVASAELETTLAEKDAAINSLEQVIKERDAKILQLTAEIAKRNSRDSKAKPLTTASKLDKALAAKERTLGNLKQVIKDKDAKITQLNAMTAKLTKFVKLLKLKYVPSFSGMSPHATQPAPAQPHSPKKTHTLLQMLK
eukprot:837216-Amorphochlora_amoeboformis.AAC.1